MNFSERCAHVTYLLSQLKDVADSLDKDACELEVSTDDDPILVRMVQGFLVCNRLSEEILYDHVPHVDQREFAVGTAFRMAHDELMKRVRGAHTDMEVYTKLRSSRRSAQRFLHAV